MARETIPQLLKRSKTAWGVKDNFDTMLRDAYMFALPQRDVYDEPSPGTPKGDRVFDATAMISTNKFANKLVNNMFPPFREWGKLVAGPGVPEEQQDEVNSVLQKVTEGMFAIIHSASNFQAAIGELALDFAGGTGAMVVQKGDLKEPVAFRAVPQIQVALEEGPHGTVSAIFRKFELTLRNVLATWPDAKLTPSLEKSKSEDPDTKIRVQEITYSNPDTGDWYYDVIVDKQKSRIVKRDIRRNPWVTPRYIKAANEVHGRGPLLQALPDIKTINKLVELILKNATMAVSGPYTVVDDGVINPDTIRLAPMAMIPVARNAGHPAGPSLAPLERAGDFSVAYLEYERIQNAIKAVMLDEELPPLTGQPRTAAEIIERVRRLASDLGATFGRITRELSVPIIQNTLDILIFDWKMFDLPDGVNIDGVNVKLIVTSPLAMQQNLEDVENIIRSIEISQALFGPQITQLAFKVEDIPEFIARKMGMPEELIRDDKDRKAIQQMVAASLAQAEQQQPGSGVQALAGAAAPQGGPGSPAAGAGGPLSAGGGA